jgi:hypothetical protein
VVCRLPLAPSSSSECRPTNATQELLDKIIYRVETENGWDQALFNECIFFPNRPGYKVLACLQGMSKPATGLPACLPACLPATLGGLAGGTCRRRPCAAPFTISQQPCNLTAGARRQHCLTFCCSCLPCVVQDPSVTRRVLDYLKFMNSKVLFKHLRHDQGTFENHMPVSVHVK